jgi:hypothetical protein
MCIKGWQARFYCLDSVKMAVVENGVTCNAYSTLVECLGGPGSRSELVPTWNLAGVFLCLGEWDLSHFQKKTGNRCENWRVAKTIILSYIVRPSPFTLRW